MTGSLEESKNEGEIDDGMNGGRQCDVEVQVEIL